MKNKTKDDILNKYDREEIKIGDLILYDILEVFIDIRDNLINKGEIKNGTR